MRPLKMALLSLLLSAPLSAATWSELNTLQPGAPLLLPAGDALWIAGVPETPPVLHDARGLPLQPIRQDGAWVLPPQAVSVWLSSETELQIRLQDSSAEGRLQLWNFATASRLFEFPGWGSAVRCLAPSPALDVVGVGLEDG